MKEQLTCCCARFFKICKRKLKRLKMLRIRNGNTLSVFPEQDNSIQVNIPKKYSFVFFPNKICLYFNLIHSNYEKCFITQKAFYFSFKVIYSVFAQTSNLVFIRRRLFWKISILVSDFSLHWISSYADADFTANDKQNRIIIEWCCIRREEHFMYFCCSSRKNFIKGGISRLSALFIMEVRSSTLLKL